MPSQGEEFVMNIEERFEKIEQENRMMKEIFERQIKKLRKFLAGVGALALTAIIAGTAGWVVAADGTFDTIIAKNIYVKN